MKTFSIFSVRESRRGAFVARRSFERDTLARETATPPHRIAVTVITAPDDAFLREGLLRLPAIPRSLNADQAYRAACAGAEGLALAEPGLSGEPGRAQATAAAASNWDVG